MFSKSKKFTPDKDRMAAMALTMAGQSWYTRGLVVTWWRQGRHGRDYGKHCLCLRACMDSVYNRGYWFSHLRKDMESVVKNSIKPQKYIQKCLPFRGNSSIFGDLRLTISVGNICVVISLLECCHHFWSGGRV